MYSLWLKDVKFKYYSKKILSKNLKKLQEKQLIVLYIPKGECDVIKSQKLKYKIL